MTDKRVESIWVPCLDEGSTPSISTKKAGIKPAFFCGVEGDFRIGPSPKSPPWRGLYSVEANVLNMVFWPAFFVEWREISALDPPLNPLLGGDFIV